LSKKLAEIRSILMEHHELFKNSIPLIASENITSPAVREALNCDFMHRYAEGWPGSRVYAGCQYIDEIEIMCQNLMKEYYNCCFADVRPISGVMANLVLYNTFTSPKGKLCCLSIASGGHISHGPKVSSSGNWIGGTAGTVRGLQVSYLPLDEFSMNIDLDKAEKVIRTEKPEMILLGASLFLFPHPVKEISKIAKDMNIYLGYDGAHVAGLISHKDPIFQDPIREGADAVSISTHKTIPGPQHGTVLSDREDLIENLKNAAFPALFSNHHLAALPSLCIAMLELMNWPEYPKKIVKNAQDLAQALYDRGFQVLCPDLGFTKSHQIVVDLINSKSMANKILGGDAEKMLEANSIIVNRNLLPWDVRGAKGPGAEKNSSKQRHYMNPGGLRLGTSEITRIGMRKSEMEAIADFFKKVLIEKKNIKQEVAEFRKDFQDVKYCFQSSNQGYEYLKFY
jgi:glycine hydroxymethyltransferase